MITDPTKPSNIAGLTAPTNCHATASGDNNPSVTLPLAASVYIQVVVFMPGGHPTWQAYQNNVDVYVVSSSGVEQYCGNSGDYNTYKEVKCGFWGNKVILKKSSQYLWLCGVVILSPCDCSTSSFTNGNFLSQTAISANQGDAQISIQVVNLSDAISLGCGNSDGITFCGAR